MKVSGFIWFVQQVYMIIIASLMFWLNFLLGFVFLGTTFFF
jgi:energy-converting hydrogenase Eha subunit B